jgi:NADH-quinone oxidoreductase subunit H
VLSIIAILALSRTLFARLRIDQMVDFCWRYVAPVAFIQILICLIAKGVLTR